MMDVSEMNMEQLDDLMSKCRARQSELRKEYIASAKMDATKDVGRCFKCGDDFVKIIGIPKVELTKTDILFNEYQRPSLHLGRRPSMFRMDDHDPVPVYYDAHFCGARGRRDPLLSMYHEISLSEFIDEYKRRMDEFMQNYIVDVIKGVNYGE